VDTTGLWDALADAEAKATFFVIAGRAAHQQLLGRMLREGHTVGVHYTIIHAVASTARARGTMLRALAPGTGRG